MTLLEHMCVKCLQSSRRFTHTRSINWFPRLHKNFYFLLMYRSYTSTADIESLPIGNKAHNDLYQGNDNHQKDINVDVKLTRQFHWIAFNKKLKQMYGENTCLHLNLIPEAQDQWSTVKITEDRSCAFLDLLELPGLSISSQWPLSIHINVSQLPRLTLLMPSLNFSPQVNLVLGGYPGYEVSGVRPLGLPDNCLFNLSFWPKQVLRDYHVDWLVSIINSLTSSGSSCLDESYCRQINKLSLHFTHLRPPAAQYLLYLLSQQQLKVGEIEIWSRKVFEKYNEQNRLRNLGVKLNLTQKIKWTELY